MRKQRRKTPCRRIVLRLPDLDHAESSSSPGIVPNRDRLSVHSVAFGGVHENVVAACSESLIRRIKQGDFEKQLAEFGFIIRADPLCQQFLRGIRVLLDLSLACTSRSSSRE